MATKFDIRELRSLSDDSIDELLVSVCRDIAQIKYQLETAKSESVNGKYADPVWFRSATHALRMKGIQHQQLTVEKSRRNRLEKEERCSRYERVFIDTARLRLSPEMFREISTEAHTIVGDI